MRLTVQPRRMSVDAQCMSHGVTDEALVHVAGKGYRGFAGRAN